MEISKQAEHSIARVELLSYSQSCLDRNMELFLIQELKMPSIAWKSETRIWLNKPNV